MKQRNFIRSREGSVMAIGAVSLVVLLGVAAAAVDISRYMTMKAEFRTAVDQATLAVASRLGNNPNPQQYAERYLRANLPERYRRNNQLEITQFNVHLQNSGSGVEVTGTARGTMETTFGSFIGVNRINLYHKAVAGWDEGTAEIVFALDNTGSLCLKYDQRVRDADPDADPGERAGRLVGRPDAGCPKQRHILGAIRYFIRGGEPNIDPNWEGIPIGTNNKGDPYYRIGLVPYTHKVRMPDTNNIPPHLIRGEENWEVADGGTAADAKEYFNNFSDTQIPGFPLPPVTPLVDMVNSGARTRILNAISNVKTHHEVQGWTRSSLGLLTAALMLDPGHHEYFGGAMPSAYSEDDNQKVVVLLSDGANAGCCFSDYPNNNYENQYIYSYRLDNWYLSGEGDHGNQPPFKRAGAYHFSRTAGLCGAMKQKGITIYTIVYDVNPSDNNYGGAIIERAFRNCATSNDHFFNIDSTNDHRMEEAYGQIVTSLIRLRLTY